MGPVPGVLPTLGTCVCLCGQCGGGCALCVGFSGCVPGHSVSCGATTAGEGARVLGVAV